MDNNTNRQELLNFGRNFQKLQFLRNRLKKSSIFFNGGIPKYEWSKKHLGDTYDKVIIASQGIEKLGETKNTSYTVIGGWCVMRTFCIQKISNGQLIDPISGKPQKIISIQQVSDWIKKAISMDGIVQAIGIYNGKEYVAISEVQLWFMKICNTLEMCLERNLNEKEKETVYKSIEFAEKKRYKITKKYIEYVSGKNINLVRIVDKDIFKELVIARDALFNKVGITINDLAKPLLTRLLKTSDDELSINIKTKKALIQYIDTSSIVWLMYTGYYVKLLQKHNYIKTPYVIIIEPFSPIHNNESRVLFNHLVYSGENAYLNKKGINNNLAYIAISESSSYNFNKSTSYLNISQVPNINNYKMFINLLKKDKSINELDLSINEAFQLGFNYLPYGKCKQLLLEMIRIIKEYKKEKKIIKTNIKKDQRSARQEKLISLKNNYKNHIYKLSIQVIDNVEHAFSIIFKD